MTAEQVTADLTFKARIDSTGGDRDPMAEKSHHVRTLKGVNAVQHKGAVDPRQLLGIIKEQIGGVLTLSEIPIIGKPGERFENLGLERMNLFQHLAEELSPVDLMLGISQLLGARRIG